VTPNNTREHLEDSILLAYIRQQQLDDRLCLRISQHIDIEQCQRCCHKLNELSRVSTALTVLGQMQAYQHYPEISVAETYARVKSAANKRTTFQAYLHQINNRQRPRMSAVRLVSLPVAFGLTILFTVAMLVFANLSGQSWIPGLSLGRTNPSQNIATTLPPHQSTPTPNLTLTATASANASATAALTPTATPVTGPYLEVCSTSTDISQMRMVICGYNFEPVHKVALIAYAPGKRLLWSRNLFVDKQGQFKVDWIIVNCRNLPASIVANELNNERETKLQNISFAGCPLPTPTLAVGPTGGAPSI
jgi:hypothetical protein